MTALSFEDLAEQDFDLKIAAAVDRAVAAPPNKDAFDCLAGAIIRLFAANTRLSASCRHLEARLNRLAARVGALEMASLGGRGPDLDRGSEALQERKRRVTGREDLPLDGAAVLYGHDRLDRQQFDGFSPADGARPRLARVCASLDGSRDLVIALAEGKALAVVLHVLDHHVTEQDEADLVRLRAGLDKISEQRRRYW